MRQDFTHNQQLAIESGNYAFHYFLDLDVRQNNNTTTERAWTGLGDIDYYPPGKSEPLTYSGMGEILGINLIPESAELRVQNTTITLSYLNERIFDIQQNYQLKGNQAKVWIGILGINNKVIDNLLLYNTMVIETVDIETEVDGVSIVINGVSGVTNLNFPTRLKWSSEDQNEYLRYLHETGRLSAQQVNRDIGFDTLKTLSAKNETADWNFGPEDSDTRLNIEPTVMNGGKINIHSID